MKATYFGLGLLMSTLASCVVIDARQFHDYTSNSTVSTSETVQPPSPTIIRVPQPPRQKSSQYKENKSGQIKCPIFLIPTRVLLPAVPDFSKVKTDILEEVIAGYIKELRAIIKQERLDVNAAHTVHLKGCSG